MALTPSQLLDRRMTSGVTVRGYLRDLNPLALDAAGGPSSPPASPAASSACDPGTAGGFLPPCSPATAEAVGDSHQPSHALPAAVARDLAAARFVAVA